MQRTKTPINYTTLLQLPTYEERFRALLLFGPYDDAQNKYRYILQDFYHSKEWKECAEEIKARDWGYDLGHSDYPIKGLINVHHIDPISPIDVIERSIKLFDHENLISVADMTHKMLHLGNENFLKYRVPIERKPNDLVPWRR